MQPSTKSRRPWREMPSYLLLGAFFGLVLVKSEVVSWFRIQEMFRFDSFHMYGVIGTAVLTAAVGIRLLRALEARSLGGEKIALEPKDWGKGARLRYVVGGGLFGIGWGLAGTCPGPIYALVGYGVGAAWVVLLSALAGARIYAALEQKLPH